MVSGSVVVGGVSWLVSSVAAGIIFAGGRSLESARRIVDTSLLFPDLGLLCLFCWEVVCLLGSPAFSGVAGTFLPDSGRRRIFLRSEIL